MVIKSIIKKLTTYIVIILSVFIMVSCSGRSNRRRYEKMILPILSDDLGIIMPRIPGEKVIKVFSYLEDENGITRPIIINNTIIGEASLFTSTEYYALINNRYKTGQITYEEYVKEMEKAYNDRDSKEFSIIISIFSNNETYLKETNWELGLIINGERYNKFKLKRDYAQEYMPYQQVLPDNESSYGKLKTSFSVNKLPEKSKPNELISLPLIISLGLDIEIPPLEEKEDEESEEEKNNTLVEWNNADLYQFYIPDDEMKKKVRGNDLTYSSLRDEKIEISVDENIDLDVSIDKFPYPIPHIEKGLFNVTIYSIGRVLNDEEYKLKKKVEEYVKELEKDENEDLREKIMRFSKKAPFSITQTILGDYVFKFDDYYNERKLIDIPEDSSVRKEHNIEKMGFISKNNRLISLTYYFEEEYTEDSASYILKEFETYKSDNILQPYTLNDRTKRISYNKDSNSLVIIDNTELKNIIDIMKTFERYFKYYKKYSRLTG